LPSASTPSPCEGEGKNQELKMSKLIHNNEIFIERRRELRQNQTPSEKKLWWYLRGQKLGAKFKRQHSIGGYILDFYCPEKKLIIELDGEVHNSEEAREYDTVRDKYFIELGYKVLRFKNEEVEDKNKIEGVLEKIQSYL
jgi:very-short-patch-repair endonuclease